jgi:hypothetical protein
MQPYPKLPLLLLRFLIAGEAGDVERRLEGMKMPTETRYPWGAGAAVRIGIDEGTQLRTVREKFSSIRCGLGEEVSMRMYYESEMRMFWGLQNVYVENNTRCARQQRDGHLRP